LLHGAIRLIGDRAPPLGEDERADQLSDRAAARPLARSGIRRVAVRGEREQLSRRREPGERDHEERRRRVADREEPRDVPRRVPAEPVVGRERPHEVGGPGKAGQENGGPREERPSLQLRQPEPEEEGERVRRGDEEADDGEREERRRVPGELLLPPDRPARQEPLARDEPPDRREQAENDDRPRGPADPVERRRASPAAAPEAERAEDEEE